MSLLLDLVIAQRNLARHARRSGVAAVAVCFGVAALILASGFTDWIFADMRESMIRSRLGHIQIVRTGFLQSGSHDPFRYLLPLSRERLADLAHDPQVELIGERIAFSGLIGRGDNSIGFVGEGVEPEKELALSRALHVVRGENLASGDPFGLVIGQGLAANLGVDVGDTVVLMANTATGGLGAIECRVRGIFTTISKLFDDSAIRLPISSARKLLKTDGTHAWVVLLKDTDATDEVLARMKAKQPGDDVEFLPWIELADFYRKTVTLFGRQIGALELIITVIIVLSITNTMLMTVVERTGEVGTALALGLKRRRIIGQFVIEGLLLGVFGAAAGLLLGGALAWLISWIGIPMPPPPGMARGYVAQIRLSVPLVVDAILLAVAASVLASLYPAWKASRLPIVDALRHNR